MNDVGAGGDDTRYLFAEAGEIGGENRRSNLVVTHGGYQTFKLMFSELCNDK
jgi:hypothetical protein